MKLPHSGPAIIIPGIAAHRPIRIIQPKSACICEASSIGAGPGSRNAAATAAIAIVVSLVVDDRSLDGDLTADFGGVKLAVDRMSSPYVQGATIDFVDTIEKQGFTIDNPNAGGSCACGDSFN